VEATKNRSNFQNKYHVKVILIVLRRIALSSLKEVQCIVAISKYDPCKIYKCPAELLSLLGYVAVSTGIVVEILEQFLYPCLGFKFFEDRLSMQAASPPKTSGTACRWTQYRIRASVNFHLPPCGNFTKLKDVPLLAGFKNHRY
jgi:hypothetical protein